MRPATTHGSACHAEGTAGWHASRAGPRVATPPYLQHRAGTNGIAFWLAFRPCSLADLVWDDKKNCAAETTQLRDQLAKMPEARGTLTYVQWMHDYLSIFTVPLEPEEVIKRASNVIASLGFWDALIRRELDTAKADHVPPRYNFERNYMPLQTKQDVIVSCNQIINALQLLRRYSDSMGVSAASSQHGRLGKAPPPLQCPLPACMQPGVNM